MRRMTSASSVVCVTIILLMCSVSRVAAQDAAASEWADVNLKDGRHFYGKIVEETPFKVVMVVYHGTVEAKFTFAKRDVQSIEYKETEDIELDQEALDALAPASDEDNETGGYALFSISGGIGAELSAQFFERALESSIRSGAEVAIFEIESPGGLVAELDRIRTTLDSFSGDIEVAFYVNADAFSAAALLCMSHEHFYIGPNARVGAAVAFSSSSGNVEVDAKYNSAMASKWRALAERSGRPGLLIDAMVMMEKEVWADTRQEPWALHDHLPAGKTRAEFEQLDDSRSILSLTASQIEKVGAADGELEQALAVCGHMNIAAPEREAFDGSEYVGSYLKQFRSNMKLVNATIENYSLMYELLENEEDLRAAERKLKKMRGYLMRVQRMVRQFDYVRNSLHMSGITEKDIDYTLRRINAVLKDL